ncbi:MAG: 16S rRNA (uracil(1498)-N(3))-methyltransferase [Deltaproteobacteria bacterium]|nr:16S rRNA (uracil(1498)-N(3))-methyltransferase [Deltaproteobacteria bacterium]
MRRFFIEEIIEKDGLCLIPEKEARHMIKVLRMKANDPFILITGKGEGFEAVIETASHKVVYARIIKALPTGPSSPINIEICQAILKPRIMDYMIEKTSELGVSRIQPFYSERTIIKPDKDSASNKIRHWRMIAQSALKQCGRPAPAVIAEPSGFKEMVQAVADKDGVKVVLWEGEQRSDLKTLLREKETTEVFTGIIGPEGGFTGQEVNLMMEAGITPVSVGTRILRAETAAIALTTIIQYEWGDLGI